MSSVRYASHIYNCKRVVSGFVISINNKNKAEIYLSLLLLLIKMLLFFFSNLLFRDFATLRVQKV